SLGFAKSGYKVVAVYVSNESNALEFNEKLQSLSKDSFVIKADVSRSEDVKRVVEYSINKHKRIDVLVNNAGIFDFRLIEDIDEKYLDKFMNINFKSQVLMIRECLKYMKENNYGRILNASSISGEIADIGLLGYGASKAAVNMLTKLSSAELAPYNITVNAYSPGIIHTDLTDSMIKERGDVQVKQISLNRFGRSEEVADLVLFLASEQASYINGQNIGIDGGLFKVQNPYRAYEQEQTREK